MVPYRCLSYSNILDLECRALFCTHMLYNSQKNLANIEMITASWYVIANTAAAVRQKSVVKGIAVHHLTP